MSEYIDNSTKWKELLKHMLLQLHQGVAPEQVKSRLKAILPSIPYNDVVEVEQQLIAEGVPVEDILKLCDVHTQVLEGSIDMSTAKVIPQGHPVDIFKQENRSLEKEIASLKALIATVETKSSNNWEAVVLQIRATLNNISDVEKHYLKKEHLLFPYMEKHGLTGPPKVMWGKHDEFRNLLKTAREAMKVEGKIEPAELSVLIEVAVQPVIRAIEEMIMKEEEILFPMCMDTLTDEEWYDIYRQIPEIGYCLYDPPVAWVPDGIVEANDRGVMAGKIMLSTGLLRIDELEAILATLPIDITFVDKDDKVRFFSNSAERVFPRTRAILGRDVRLCHPPGSVHVVEQILSDFKSGRQNSAAFWINFHGRFIYIEYFAVRDREGNYMGTLEFTQDATQIRSLEGERRILNYEKP
jgi:DUF438 domain-containing protein